MSVSISDGTYNSRIAPRDRSDGFQWYLSFYAAMLNEVSDTRPTVFLLDNPGLELHSDGQRDIKRFLEEKLPTNAQVIYVTHSPAMIDPFHLEQVRQVELQPDGQGTKVRKLSAKAGSEFDLLEPARTAIGASLVSTLICNDLNVLVEGAADKPILEGAIFTVAEDHPKKVLVNGSLAESKDGFLVRFYQRANLPFVCYLDADSNGRRVSGELNHWGVPKEKIIMLDSVFTEREGDFELEDILSEAFYHMAACEAYPEFNIPTMEGGQGKRTKSYEEHFENNNGPGFSKRRVAEKVKKLLIEGKGDEETVANLRRVIDSIIAGLNAQITPAHPKDDA